MTTYRCPLAPRTLRHSLNTLALAIGIALFGGPMATQAQSVPDTQAGLHRPSTDTAANGTPVVNIVAPSSAGVSHNQYLSFNVDNKGLILNNSSSTSQTQLAGMVAGNTNLSAGQSARIILNEVTGTSRTALNGYTEVAGNAADVIVANPNGITVNGGGFINTTRSVLTTGTPTFGGDGSLQAFRVSRGTIAIDGGGLDATHVDRLDLIARAVQANASVWAHELNVVTGANEVDYNELTAQAIRGEGSVPGVSLDVAALGGMYADKIRLLGTEAGLGVRNNGEIAAQAGDFKLTSAGRLEVIGKLVASGNLTVVAGGLDNHGTLATDGDLNALVDGDIVSSGMLYAGQGASFASSGNVRNSGKLYAVDGLLDVSATGALTLTDTSDVYAEKGIVLHGGSLDNAGALSAGGNLQLTVTQSLVNTGTVINTGSTSVDGGQIENRGHWQSGDDLVITAQSLHNSGLFNGKGNVSLTVDHLDSDLDSSLHAARDLTIATSGPVRVDGVLQADQNLQLSSVGALDVGAQGALYGGEALSLTSAGKLTNAGAIYALDNIQMHAAGLANAGTIRTDHDLTATVSGDMQSKGSVLAVGNVTLAVDGTLDNTGKLYAVDGSLNATVEKTFSNAAEGDVYASNSLNLRSLRMTNAGVMESAHAITLSHQSGLRNLGMLLANGGDLTVDAGWLDNVGTLASDGRLDVLTKGDIINSGQLYAGQGVSLVGGADIRNSGKLYAVQGTLDAKVAGALSLTASSDVYAGQNVRMHGASLINLGTIEAGAGLDFGIRDRLANGGLLLASGGDTTLAATRLDNVGTLSVAGSLQLTGTRALVNAGTVINVGSATVQGGQVDNTGQWQSGGNLVINAQSLRNRGLLSGQSHVNLTVGSFNANMDAHLLAARNLTIAAAGPARIDGVLQAGQDLQLSSADSIDVGSQGLLRGGQTLTLSGTGTLNNAGLIYAIDDIQVNLTGLSNAGMLRADRDLTVIVGGDMQNAGSVLAAGNVTLDVIGMLANTGKLYGVGGALDAVTGAAFNNAIGGDVYAGNGLTVHGYDITNAGVMESARALTLSGPGGLRNTGTLLADSGDLKLSSGNLDNSGMLSATGNASLTAAGTLNSTGVVVSSVDLELSGHAINLAGQLQAGRDLRVQADALANAGVLYAQHHASLAGGDIINAATATMLAAGNLTFANTGMLTNRGLLQAGQDLLAVQLDGLDNAAGASAQAGHNFTLNSNGTIINNGALDAVERLALRADTLTNRGLLRGDGTQMVWVGGDANNDGSAYAGASSQWTVAGQLTNTGTLAAQGNLDIDAGSLVSNGVLGAGVRVDGSIGGPGVLSVSTQGVLVAQGRNVAANELTFHGAGINLDGGTIRANHAITLTASSGALNLRSSDVATSGTLALQAAGALDNSAGSLLAGDVAINAASFANQGGRLLQTGTSASTFVVAGTLDNRGGSIANNADTWTVQAAHVLNANGSIAHAGNDQLALRISGQLNNSAGSIAGNGTLHIIAGGALANVDGDLSAGGDLSVHAQSLDNTTGTLAADAINISLTQELLNTGGIVQAGGDLTVHAGSLANGDGQIKTLGGDVLALDVTQELNNGADGFIAGNGAVNLQAGSITNAGQVYAGTDMAMASNGKLDNRNGALQAMGAGSIKVVGKLDNRDGRIEVGNGRADATLTVIATELDNRAGYLVNAALGTSSVRLDGGVLGNAGGTLGGQGDVTVSAGAISNTGNGTVVAGRDLSLTAASLDNTGGTLYAAHDLAWINPLGALINQNGHLGAGGNALLALASLDNEGGETAADGDLSLAVGSMTGSGRVVAGNDLALTLAGSYSNVDGNLLKANRNVTLTLDGTLDNAVGSTLDAVGALTINATSISNSGVINSAATTLATAGALTNQGRIEGDTLTINAGNLDNTGILVGDTITVHARDLTNGSDLGDVTDNSAYDSAVIAATGDVSLYVTDTLLNRDALIYAMGNVTVGGASGNRAGAITNRSGSIEADGSIVLAANQITNERRVLQSETYALSLGEQAQNTLVTSHPVDTTTDPGAVAFCGSLGKKLRCKPGENLIRRETTVMTSLQRLLQTSVQGRIAAGQNISLGGSVLNEASTIAAAQNLLVNGYSGSVADGTAMLGGESIQNVGWVPTASLRTETEDSIQVQKKHKCALGTKNCWKDNGTQYFGQTSKTSELTLSGSLPSWVNVAAGPDASSFMTAGGTLAIYGTTIANTTVDVDGSPVNASVTLDNTATGQMVAGTGTNQVGNVGGSVSLGNMNPLDGAPASGSVSSLSVLGATVRHAGSAPGTQAAYLLGMPAAGLAGSIHAPVATVRNAGPAPGAQTVGSFDAPGGQLQLPEGGLFTTHPGDSAGYLVETDQRFASAGDFSGSDYLTDQLSWNGEGVLKRLGDAFYENRLVLDQITALTGRRLLNDSTNTMAQYRELMDSGVAAAGQFDLTVGVALTAQQMASLTDDVVWMVSQQVNGESVLVPVVYLSAKHAENVGNDRGAVMAGKDIILDADGSLINTGSVLANRDANLKAGTLLNTGKLSAGDALSIGAAQDILNAGRIQGGNVAMVAERDVFSGIDLGNIDLGGVDLGVNLSPIDMQRLGLATGGSIVASGDLAVLAGRDLTLNQASVSAGRDLALVAGRDLSATAAPIIAGGDAALVAGRDLHFAAIQQTTLSGNRTSLTRSTTHTVSSMAASGSLALVAGRDISSEGTAFKAGNTLVVSAGRDLTLNAVTDVVTNQEHHKEGRTFVSTRQLDETLRGTTLDARNDIVVSAGRDLTTVAATLGSADGSITLGAGRDIALNAGMEKHEASRDTQHKKSGLLSSKTTRTHDAIQDQFAVGTLLDGSSITVAATHDLVTQGAQLTAADVVVLSAGHNVVLGAAQDSYSEQHDRQTTQRGGGLGVLVGTSKGDLFTRTNKSQHDASRDLVAVGSLVSGDTVTVAAGNDLITEAAQIAGTGELALVAGHDLIVGTADTIHTEEHGYQVATYGAQRSGLHGMFGVSRANQTGTEVDVTPSGSVIGSTAGSVTLSAGKDVQITASDVISQTGTAIVGQNVTIEAGVGTVDSHQAQSLHTGGIMAGLTGGAASQAEQAWASGQRAGQAKDKRMKLLYAAQAGYSAYSAYQSGTAGVGSAESGKGAQGAADSSGISLRIGIGASTASGHSNTHDDIAYASHIHSAGDVTIAATDGDLNVVGSQITGENVALAASNDINLLSRLERHRQKDSSANASGEVGVSIGSTTGIYVSAAGGLTRAKGNGETHAISSVVANDTLRLISGNDTNIIGAQARGNAVLADIGGDLNLASEQDTNDFASRNMQGGITLVYGFSGTGVGVNASFAHGMIDSDYASVTKVSGITAGEGGYLIEVGGNTDLKSAVIASTADPSNNLLSTGSLSYSDIENKAKYSSTSFAISMNYDSAASGPNKLGGTVMPPLNSRNSRTDTTHSAIAPGGLFVADGTGMDIRRDTTGGSSRLRTYDIQAIESDQAFASELVGTAVRVADDYYTHRATKLTQQMKGAETNAKNAELAGDVESSQRYWRESAALREQRDNPAVGMAEVRGAAAMLASAATGNLDLRYTLQSSAIGYTGDAWKKAGVGHNETMALKVTCTNKNANDCANGIQIPKNLSSAERIVYAKEHGLDIQYVSEIPQGARVIASNGIINDEARAAQVAIGHAAGDKGTSNHGNAKNMTIYLQFNDTKGLFSDLMQAGFDKFAAPWGSDYSATTYAMAAAVEKQGGAELEMDGHSWGSITTRNALYVLANNGYQNGNLVVKVFGPAVSPEDMINASTAAIGKDVIKSRSLFYYSNPNDPVASFVGGTLRYSAYLDPTKLDQHLPGAAQGNALGALKGVKAVFGGALNPHSCYALNCQNVPGGEMYNWTVQTAEQDENEDSKP